jgi:hypothetical protein
VNKDGKSYIQVKVKGETKVFSPEEISAMILGKMKETAESYLGKKIKNAVVTVPGTFQTFFFGSYSDFMFDYYLTEFPFVLCCSLLQ